MEDEDEDIIEETDPGAEGDGEEETAGGEPEGAPDQDAAEDDGPDGEPEDGDDAEETGDLPQGVRKRLAKVTAKRRAAEARAKELEGEVERLRDRAESPELYRALAERHGILPDLIGEREAKGLRDLDEAARSAEALRDLLDDLEDSGESETELGGKTVTRAQLRKSLREQERRAADLRERFGDAGKRLRARTLALIKLGLAAEQAQGAAKARTAPAAKETKPRGDAGRPARVRRGDVNGLGERRDARGEDPGQRLDRLILAGIRSRRG